MSNYKKLFAMFVLCAAAFVSHPSKSQAAAAPILQTYDQCMSWCMTQYDFFTCDPYCSQYPSGD